MSPREGVQKIEADETRALRQAILRPGERVEDLAWAGDEGARTLHLGKFVAGTLVAVATVIEEREPAAHAPPSARATDRAWRVRGMATLAEHRGAGHGGELLRGLIAHAETQGADVIWCHARPKASSFYEREGFVAVGSPYEVPGAGPHLYMRRVTRT